MTTRHQKTKSTYQQHKKDMMLYHTDRRDKTKNKYLLQLMNTSLRGSSSSLKFQCWMNTSRRCTTSKQLKKMLSNIQQHTIQKQPK